MRLNKLFQKVYMEIIYQQSGLQDIKDAVRYQQIINGGNIEEICKIAEDPNTPLSILNKLSINKNQDVRKAVARNPNTPPDVLTKLINDYNFVRQGVAENPNTPLDVLAKLSIMKDVDIRRSVAENPNTPRDILIKLRKDPSVYVRKAAMNNPSIH